MPIDTAAGGGRFAALADVLSRERAALDRLAFKVSTAELLAASGEARFLAMIVDEVDDVADELGTMEIVRAMIVAELCAIVGKPDRGDISLSDLIAHAPPDVGAGLTELRAELLELTDDLAATATRGSAAAHIQRAAIRAALNRLEPATTSPTN